MNEKDRRRSGGGHRRGYGCLAAEHLWARMVVLKSIMHFRWSGGDKHKQGGNFLGKNIMIWKRGRLAFLDSSMKKSRKNWKYRKMCFFLQGRKCTETKQNSHSNFQNLYWLRTNISNIQNNIFDGLGQIIARCMKKLEHIGNKKQKHKHREKLRKLLRLVIWYVFETIAKCRFMFKFS